MDDSDDATSLTRAEGPRPAGRYALLDRLGSGGMADVFLALAKGPFDAKKLVVLKRPRAASPEIAEMFMDEARLAMRLNHPNVVQTYEVGVDDGGFFLAMEYLEGQPLHRVIEAMQGHGEHLSHAHVARLISDVLAGLHYAHTLADYDGTPLQIVHRDVSPHNVFVTYEGQVKVVDFGIAKATMNEVHTRTGDVKGKLAYMAPEQAIASTVDRRADVFSAGVMLWEMIARRRLLTGASSTELLDNLLKMDFPPLSAEVPDVHPVLEAVAMRALQRDADDRYASAAEMRDALESYIGIAMTAVRASDYGGVVSRLFAGARSQLATRIRAHMQPGAARPSANAASGPRLPLIDTNPMLDGPTVNDTNGPSVVTSSPLAAPARRTGWRTIATVTALAVSIVALSIALILSFRDRAAPATASSAAEPSALVGIPVATDPLPAPTVLPAASLVPVPLPVSSPSPSPRSVPRRPSPPPATPTSRRSIDTSFPK